MGNADLEAKLAALKKAEADLAGFEAQIKAERERIEKVNEAIQAAPPDPDEDPEAASQTYGMYVKLDRLVAHAQGLKWLIVTKKAAIADAAKPSTDLFQGMPLGENVFDEPAPSPEASIDPKPAQVQPPSPPPLTGESGLGYELAVADAAKPSTDIFQGMPLGENVFDEPAPGLEASIEPAPSQVQPPSPPPLTGESGLGYEYEVAAAPDTRKRVAVVAALVIVALLGVGAVVARLGSGPSPTPTAPAVAVATPTDPPIPTVSRAPTATVTAPTLAPLPTGPIRYSSDCNGECFMTVDPVSCDVTFHFVLSLLDESATAFDGKTAIISTVGPGLQPTYEVPVVGGKVTLDAVAKGSDYGGNPNAGCGVNAHWTGLLTSVDGKPTTTPNAPT